MNQTSCRKNYTKYFTSEIAGEPTAKRYVYCLRALLSAKYCAKKNDLPPLKFGELVAKTLKADEQGEIGEMVDAKKRGREKEKYENPKWKEYIRSSLENGRLLMNGRKQDDHQAFYKILNMHLMRQLE